MKAPISLCLIVKNEPLLEKCILSIKDYVAEIVIVDTGSTDGTDLIAKKYANKYELYTTCNDLSTGLINDFSEARQHSFNMATQPWIMWADADDEISGADKLLKIISSIDSNKNTMIMLPYEYSYNEQGKSTCTHYRERIISNKNNFHWLNPVHEVLVPNNGIEPNIIINDEILYKHHRQYGTKQPEAGRNLRILRNYFEKHGDSDARQMYYLGLECYNAGLVDEAIERLVKYIDISGWDDERAMACLKLIDIYIEKGQYEAGVQWGFKLIALKETWGEGYFALGKLFYFMAQKGGIQENRHWERCANFIKMGLSFPATKTLLFINPTERNIEIHKYYNMALHKLGKFVEALESVKTALLHNPDDISLLNNKKCYEEYLAKNEANIALNKLIDNNILDKDSYDLIIKLLNDKETINKVNKDNWNIPIDLDLQGLPLNLNNDQLESNVIMLWKQFMLRNKGESAVKFLESANSIVEYSNIIQSAISLSKNYKDFELKTDKLDIVFFAGDGVEVWTPETVKNTGIGGSELMLLEQAKRLAALGHKVRVYNSCGSAGIYDNVQYYPTNQFVNLNCDVLVVSRRADMLGDEHNIKAKLKLLWIHDVCAIGATNELLLKADRILVLSEWHKQNVMQTHHLHSDHIIVTRNGIDLNRFKKDIKRNRFRVINSSSPDRSWPILLDCWSIIKAKVPEAELHLFYGFKNWEHVANSYPGQMDLINRLKQTIKDLEPFGVVYHDRINQETLAEEMLKSGIWAFPSWFTETSCCHPDTLISLPGDHSTFSNCDIKIKDLLNKINFPVYCFDLENQKFTIGTCKKVWITKNVTQLISITLDNNSILKLTPDHLVMNYDGEYIRADALKINDRLMALHFRHNVMIKDFDGNWVDESRLVGEWKVGRKLLKNEHVDHLDPARLNNNPDMLQVLTSSDHAKKTHKNNIQSKLSLEKRKKSFKKYCLNNKDKLKARAVTRANKFWKDTYSTWTEEKKTKFNNQRAEIRIKNMKEKMENDPIYAAEYIKNKSEDGYKAAKSFWNKFNELPEEERKKFLSNKNKKSAETKRLKKEIEHQLNGQNHKIINIEIINEETEVYDMEVEKYHNFIANGIVVHNCISAMEAQAAGLRMVTSNIAALKETVGKRGVLIDGEWTSLEYKTQFINEVIKALKNEDDSDRLLLQEYAKNNLGLDDLAKSWDKMFYELIEYKKENPIIPYLPTAPYREGGRGYYDGDTRR